MGEFTMPSLGADMDAGTLLEWHVKPGDAVKRGDIVALVDTDKAAIEVEIFEDGVIGELLVPPGEKVPVGTALATILPPGTAITAVGAAAGALPIGDAATQGEPAAAPTEAPAVPPEEAVPAPPVEAAPAPPAGASPADRRPAPAPAAVPAAVTTAERPMATPAARNHARALGIDLSTVLGTGKHGVITPEDVDAAARTAEAAVAEAAVSERAAAETAAAEAGPAEPAEGQAEARPAAAEAAGRAAATAPGRAKPVPAGSDRAESAAPRPDAGAPSHVRASPLARRLATELGVDLTRVAGSGPGGAVTQEDVRAVAAGVAPATPAATVAAHEAAAPAATAPRAALPAEPPAATKTAAKPEDARYAAMRRAIAAAMSKSKREIPHYYLSLHVDMTRPLAWLEEANLQRPVTERILPAALVLKATALAARDVPDVNGFYLDDGFHLSEAIHLGVGISLKQGGLIAPAIHDADKKDLDTLMADLRDLVKRTRSLQLRSSELSDATMTTTNLGDQGVESVYGIIYPPQVALVGYGRILERPWAENGMLAVRRQMQLTLAADHRASDGHRGGLFLSAIERHLQHPEEL